MLHAGLEGIEKGYELPPPMETNLYDLTPEERDSRGIKQLPETLGEAIEEMEGSELVLKALGEHVFSTLMGERVEPRRDFIRSEARKVRNLDF